MLQIQAALTDDGKLAFERPAHRRDVPEQVVCGGMVQRLAGLAPEPVDQRRIALLERGVKLVHITGPGRHAQLLAPRAPFRRQLGNGIELDPRLVAHLSKVAGQLPRHAGEVGHHLANVLIPIRR